MATPLARADVQGVYAGLRPLLAGESENTSALSREHVVAHPVPGLVVVAGGKYTTYRVMARDAVDAAVHALNERVPPSCTERIPLIGGAGYQAAWNSRERTAASTGLHVARVEHLLRRYGADLGPVLDLAASDPTLREPLTGAEDHLRAEVIHATAWEGARHLEDVMTRRTRISVETFDRGVGAAAECAHLMGSVLGWTAEQTANEIEHYIARVAAELRVAGPTRRPHRRCRPHGRPGHRPDPLGPESKLGRSVPGLVGTDRLFGRRARRRQASGQLTPPRAAAP